MREFSRLSPFLRPYGLKILLALVITLCLSALLLATPTVIRLVIDYGLMNGNRQLIALCALALLCIGIMRASLVYSQRYLGEWIAAHIGYDFRNRLYDHIQHLPFSFHDHSQTGQLISRCIEDVRAIERFTGYGIIEFVRLGLLMVGIIAILFWQSPQLASVALLPLIPLILITAGFGSKVGKYFYQVDMALGELSAHIQENVSGVQVVRAFAREPYEIGLFAKKNRRLYHARVTVNSIFAWVMPTTHFLVALGTIIILWVGGNMVLQGEMTVGEVVAFNGYLLLLTQPAQQLAWLVNSAGEAKAGIQRTFEVLDLEPDIQAPPNAIQIPTLQGRVEFCSVYMNYQEQLIPALESIDLSVEPNQVVALIGPTGSGKTSLVSLIPRFYDPSQGSVLIDGVDIRQLELVSLRRQIGIVLQTSLLFSISVAENIAYGKPEANQEEIESVAKAAQAHEFIMGLPAGYQTIVGERGVTLSGGQRQRIAIARALLMDPRILILDDSTSNVDTETESLIQKALSHLMAGRTTFIIAHRLSTVRRADLILVMQDGRIVEKGQHEQLLRGDGLYREIFEMQLRGQEPNWDAVPTAG